MTINDLFAGLGAKRSFDYQRDIFERPKPRGRPPPGPNYELGRARGRACPALPARTLCHHPNGVHGSRTASPYSTLTANDTVVAFAHSFPAVFENIPRVLPDTKTIAVVNGNSPIEKFWLEEIRREARRFANRITFTWYNEFSFEDILKRAAALPSQSAIFWHLMNVDAAGVVHEDGKALKRLYAVANAPIFSYKDAFLAVRLSAARCTR